MTRSWLSFIAIGALAAACAQPNPPSAPGVVMQPADSGPPQSAGPGIPPGPMTDNMPPSALDANPPGTPSYVIAPGDPTGQRNSQIPRPGGKPAF